MAATPSIGSFLWLLIVLFSLLMYIILDGYDLGIGMLLLTERDDARRKEMMEIVATAWDGNESWLILVGVGLFGGFPLAYGILLPALYVPFILMLFALMFRGISIEFQSQSPDYRRDWGLIFAIGSFVAALCQGVILGSILTGIPVVHDHFAGEPFSFLSAFSLLTAVFLIAAYCLNGATWLNDKTDGTLQTNSQQKGRLLTLLVGALLIVVLIIALLSSPVIGPIVLSSRLLFLIGVVILAGVALLVARSLLKRTNGLLPFLLTVFALALGILGLLSINYPYMVPPAVTIWQAASTGSSVSFLLVGVGLCMPVVIAYNAYAYYVFRGKFTLPELRKASS